MAHNVIIIPKSEVWPDIILELSNTKVCNKLCYTGIYFAIVIGTSWIWSHNIFN